MNTKTTMSFLETPFPKNTSSEKLGKTTSPEGMLELNRKRFQELANQHNQKWKSRIRRALGLEGAQTEIDIAREQAEIENKERTLQSSPEFQRSQEHLRQVIEDVRNPERDPRPKVLIFMGGGLRGPYCAAQAAALQDLGFGSSFDVVIGVSAGSGPAAFFVAGPGEMRKATSLFEEDCSGSDFLDVQRIFTDGKVIDTSVIARKLRSGDKSLNEEAIRQSSVELLAAATNITTGKVELLNMKKTTRDGKLDMTAAAEASSCIPLFEKPFEVNGQQYVDGSVGVFPLEEILKQYDPSSVLILPNMSFGEFDDSENTSPAKMLMGALKSISKIGSLAKTKLGQKLDSGSIASLDKFQALEQTLGMIGGNHEMYRDIHESQTSATRQSLAIDALERIQKESGTKMAILWPPKESLDNLKNNRSDIRSAMISSYLDVYKQLNEAPPEEVWI